MLECLTTSDILFSALGIASVIHQYSFGVTDKERLENVPESWSVRMKISPRNWIFVFYGGLFFVHPPLAYALYVMPCTVRVFRRLMSQPRSVCTRHVSKCQGPVVDYNAMD